METNGEAILKLSIEEKILITEKIWDSLASDEKKVPVPSWHLDLIEERINNHASGNGGSKSWEEVKQKYFI